MIYTENNLKLCYIDGDFAYFTTIDLSHQWGDDWDDAPYECNAGPPYNWDGASEPKYEIKKVTFDADNEILIRPFDKYNNSPYSVRDINERQVPWLRTDTLPDRTRSIYAGASFQDFVKFIKSCGGNAYLQIKQDDHDKDTG